MLMPVKHTMTQPDVDEGTPVSVKIRERIVAARKRFHANDNIADFIEPGELDRLLDEVQVALVMVYSDGLQQLLLQQQLLQQCNQELENLVRQLQSQ